MSKLQMLIDELCPNGVEYIVLKNICNIYDGTHKTPKYTDSGIKFVSVENINALYDTQKYISVEDFEKYKIKPQKNDVLMTRIGTIGTCAVVGSNEPLAYYVSLALLRPDLTKINAKYLKYVIESKHGRKELRKRTLINAVPIKVNMGDIGKITIPVPPIEVQSEIVRILDNFTELTARKQQYGCYTEMLLNSSEDVDYVPLGNLANFTYGYTDKASDLGTARFIRITDINEQGCLNVNDKKYINFSKDSEKYLLKYGDLVVARTGATYGKTLYFENEEPSVYASFLIKIELDNAKILNRYYWHFTKSPMYWEQADNLVSKGGQPQFNTNAIKRVIVPVPSLERQKYIVNILDRFDKLCNDMSEGLPAEIEARQKQYEYYRDRLLTFEEKK